MDVTPHSESEDSKMGKEFILNLKGVDNGIMHALLGLGDCKIDSLVLSLDDPDNARDYPEGTIWCKVILDQAHSYDSKDAGWKRITEGGDFIEEDGEIRKRKLFYRDKTKDDWKDESND